MRAIVKKANNKRGFVVFETEDYDCGWFEILDTAELDADDELIGNFTELGGTTITKKSTGESVEIFIEDYGMSYKKALEMIFR